MDQPERDRLQRVESDRLRNEADRPMKDNPDRPDHPKEAQDKENQRRADLASGKVKVGKHVPGGKGRAFVPGKDPLREFKSGVDPYDPRYPKCDPNDSSRPNPIDPNPPTNDTNGTNPAQVLWAFEDEPTVADPRSTPVDQSRLSPREKNFYTSYPEELPRGAAPKNYPEAPGTPKKV